MVRPNPSDSRGEGLSGTKVCFLSPCHSWTPLMPVVPKYRQLTGGASCGTDPLYFYTGGALFECGTGHWVPSLRVLVVFFSPSRQLPWHYVYQATAAGLRILFTTLSHDYFGIRRCEMWGIRRRRLKCVATVIKACVFRSIFRRVRKVAKSCCYLRRGCLSFLLQQLGSHRTDFHEICYLSIFLISVEKIRISLKSEKNNGYFT